ncbi:MAG: response regulator [Treponema sp.]|nr:response regulator [Treponema sp.]
MKPCVLCVDDEAILTLALTRSLKSAFGTDVHVDAASSAEEAFEAISELAAADIAVKVVVCDLLMPVMRGDEFIARLRELHPAIKSILLTGLPDDEESARLNRELNLFASLSKPVKTAQLVEIVGKALAAAP